MSAAEPPGLSLLRPLDQEVCVRIKVVGGNYYYTPFSMKSTRRGLAGPKRSGEGDVTPE